MYSDETLERFKAVSNMGSLSGDDVVMGEVGNVYCGDIMRLYLRLDGKKIIDAKFKTFGCVAAILSTDIACELIKGKTLDEATQVTNEQVRELMGMDIPKQKIHCSVMAQEAIAATIENFNNHYI